MKLNKKAFILKIFSLLIVFEGSIVLSMLMKIPGEGKGRLIVGFSQERIILLLLTGFVPLCCLILLLVFFYNHSFRNKTLSAIDRFLNKKHATRLLLIASLVVFLSGLEFILLSPEITEPFTVSIFIRLRPIVTLFTAISAQILLLLPIYRDDAMKIREILHSGTFRTIALVFTLFLAIWVLIAVTRVGLVASDVGAGWYALGNPILGWQVLLAWILSSGLLGLLLTIKQKPARAHKFLTATDIIISIMLWVLAFNLWMSVPLEPSWFAAPPRPPNYAFYPNSDASVYDTTAQSAMVGEGFQSWGSPFAIRPMYALLLTLFHSIGGTDYVPIIWMQIALLAFLPIGLYWLAKHLHSRLAGVLLALLVIFRETNAISLGNIITNSHAKLLMSDLPATLGVVLFFLMVTIWLQNPKKHTTVPLAAGGVLGVFMLIRPELVIFFLVLIPVAFLQLKRTWQRWFKAMLLFTAGVLLMLSPWIWRNYQLTGTIFLDSPHYRADLFAKRYRDLQTPQPESATQTPKQATTSAATPLPATQIPAQTPASTPVVNIEEGESFTHFTNRMFQDVYEYILHKPGNVARFFFNHFANSTIQTVLYLPSTNRFFDSSIAFLGHHDTARLLDEGFSAQGLVRRLPFWLKWDGTLPKQSFLPVFLDLLLVAIGLSITWHRQKWIGIFPILAAAGHYATNALVRNSGGRYILPIDWVGALFFAIGIAQLTFWLFPALQNETFSSPSNRPAPAVNHENTQTRLFSKTNLLLALLILGIGSLLPIVDKIVPSRYPPQLLETRLNQINRGTQKAITREQITILNTFLENGGTSWLGRALYPRYHRAGMGESGSTWPAFYPQPFPRISFYTVGQKNTGVILPGNNKTGYFPHGSDILVFACPKDNYYEALAVMIYNAQGDIVQAVFRKPLSDNPGCSP